jgi:hypothetical protein
MHLCIYSYIHIDGKHRIELETGVTRMHVYIYLI